VDDGQRRQVRIRVGVEDADSATGPVDHPRHPGKLTVATGNPAYPPWFEGGTKSSFWKINDPNNDEGYESAVTYAVARQLGFTEVQVRKPRPRRPSWLGVRVKQRVSRRWIVSCSTFASAAAIAARSGSSAAAR
jgi:hypothetical protein